MPFIDGPPVEEVDVEVFYSVPTIHKVPGRPLAQSYKEYTVPLVLAVRVAPEKRIVLCRSDRG